MKTSFKITSKSFVRQFNLDWTTALIDELLELIALRNPIVHMIFEIKKAWIGFLRSRDFLGKISFLQKHPVKNFPHPWSWPFDLKLVDPSYSKWYKIKVLSKIKISWKNAESARDLIPNTISRAKYFHVQQWSTRQVRTPLKFK